METLQGRITNRLAFDVCLTPNEVERLHGSAYMPFNGKSRFIAVDEKDIGRIIDQSGNGNHGTIHGNVKETGL